MAIRVSDTATEKGSRAMEARRANDRIADKAERLRFVSRVPMLCECSADDCRTILLDLDDYRKIRWSCGAFFTAPGHDTDGTELEQRLPDYDIRRVRSCHGGADGGRRSA
jgi:hypothetical protein